jgi:hypothetical protein
MSELKQRIVAQGSDLTDVGIEDGPTALANDQVIITPGVSGYQITSLISPDGRPILATAPGQWGQVRAAGRP